MPPAIASFIDHTLLKPEATAPQIEQLCQEARNHNFAAVCVNPSYVKLAAQLLAGSGVAVCTVVGFPLGATLTEVKVFETEQVIQHGATEVDMVINIGALKGGQPAVVEQDITAVVVAAHRQQVLCKVIIETAMLTNEEKVLACQLAEKAGADFVKTSTGFGGGGATVEDVSLMRQTVGSNVSVKAAGGIKTLAQARQLIAAGAARLGTSAGAKIAQEERSSL